MKGLSKATANWLQVGADSAGQRVDNYLTKQLKGVPKSHIYRILRSGEVRVNSRRVGPDHRLSEGDRLRVPPIRTSRATEGARPSPPRSRRLDILFEDESLLVIDKPAGMAVHGGSGVSYGVVEYLRFARPHAPFLELVHRLDRETSGALMLAKRRPALVALHRDLREGHVQKSYLVLVKGCWNDARRNVRLPLHKRVLPSGERRVSVSERGVQSHTVFQLRRRWAEYSLLEADLKTGRTHQIRVHLAHLGYPVVGDDKYGDFALNKALVREGLQRMFLHACRIVVRHPDSGARLVLEAPLPSELNAFLAKLDATGPGHAAAF